MLLSMNLEISSFNIKIDMATVTKCTKSLTGADRFLKSSISETINKIVVEIKKINHRLSKKP